MSYLGTWLELAEGADLSEIGLTPFSREVTEAEARVFLHRVRISGQADGAAVAGALARFLPTAIATLGGSEPDGRAWGAVIQYVPEPGVPPLVRATATWGLPRRTSTVADAAFRRALRLTGVRGQVTVATFSDIDLRVPYEEEGADVTDWNATDLVVGLLYELASNIDLDDLVSRVTHSSATGRGQREHRAEALHELLRAWAETYEGPRA